MKYRKKPLLVDALQWTGANYASMERFLESAVHGFFFRDKLYLMLGDNEVRCRPGMWIVKGATGDFHPVPEHVFAQVYESVETEELMHHPV